MALLGWYYPFFLPILAVPVALMVLWRLQTPEPSSDQGLSEYLRNTFLAIRNPQALVLFFASLITFVILYGAYLTYLPFLLRQSFDASPVLIGLLFSATSVATAITSFRLGRLARRFSPQKLIYAGFILYALSMTALPLAPTITLLLLPAALFGVANGISIPSILTMLTGLAPAEYRGAFMSVNATVLRMGQTLGPLVAGAMMQFRGLSGAYFGSAVLAVAALGVISTVMKEG